MRILVACELSGVVRDAFSARGHDAWSCDIEPCERGGKHFTEDVMILLRAQMVNPLDIMIAFPPCTHLAVSGARYFAGKAWEQQQALLFVEALWRAAIPKIAIENPVGILSTKSRLMKPAQTIQPYDFGENASKRTCLWLKGLPKLRGTCYVPPRHIGNKKRWANQTDSGQNKLTPSPLRGRDRARTYEGIAAAMADQWGELS